MGSIPRKNISSNFKVRDKNSEQQWTQLGYHNCLLTSPRATGSLLRSHQNLDLKQQVVICYSRKYACIHDQQRIAVWDLQPWRAMCNPPHGERRILLQKGKEVGGNESETVYGFLLAESLTGKKRNLFCWWTLPSLQCVSAPPSDIPALLI